MYQLTVRSCETSVVDTVNKGQEYPAMEGGREN